MQLRQPCIKFGFLLLILAACLAIGLSFLALLLLFRRYLAKPLRQLVAGMNTRQIGLSVVGLGGGRTRSDQSIDHSVGFS